MVVRVKIGVAVAEEGVVVFQLPLPPVRPTGVVDKSELKQRTEDKENASAGPDIDRLQVVIVFTMPGTTRIRFE